MVSVYVKEGSGVLKSSLGRNVTETRKTTLSIVAGHGSQAGLHRRIC